MLDIKGENVKLWVNERKGRDNKLFKTYSISVSKKREDGGWVRKYVDMIMTKNVIVPDGITNGTYVNFTGFPSVKLFTNKSGDEVTDLAIMVQSLQLANGETQSEPQSGDYELPSGFAEADENFDCPF